MIADQITFIRQIPKNFIELGSICPSSKAFAKRMVENVRSRSKPLRILEVGPGTGPITRAVLSEMGPEDEFTVCEINSEFLRVLEENLEKVSDYQKHKKRVTFFAGPVQEIRSLSKDLSFDVIICCLPFNNFPPELVQEIMELFSEIARPGGSLTLMEYAGIREFCSVFAPKDMKQRLRAVEKVMSVWEQKAKRAGNFKRTLTLRNLPPAFAIHMYY